MSIDVNGREPMNGSPEQSQQADDLRRTVDQLQHALESRVAIEQAKGIIAERHGVSFGEAFEVLRDHARSNGLRLHAVAEALVREVEGSARRSMAVAGNGASTDGDGATADDLSRSGRR